MSSNDSPRCDGWRRISNCRPERCTAPATCRITIAAAGNGNIPDYLNDLTARLHAAEAKAAKYRELLEVIGNDGRLRQSEAATFDALEAAAQGSGS